MSYGSDCRSEIEAESELFFGISLERMRQKLWTQRDGTQIHVRNMTRSHIENTIAMLKRGNSIFKESWITIFEDELSNREYIRKCAKDNW